MHRTLPVAALAALLVGAVLVGVVLHTDDVAPPRAEITNLTVTDRGCDADLRDFSPSGGGARGSYYDAGTMTVESMQTTLSAEIRHTSPAAADVRTYRVDLTTHQPTNESDCQPEIAYRLEYNVTSGSAGTRHAVYVDGDAAGCGGWTSGPDIGCDRLMSHDAGTHWSNATKGE